jgi:hypothetical protein
MLNVVGNSPMVFCFKKIVGSYVGGYVGSLVCGLCGFTAYYYTVG